jgi:hypothetical protein
MYQEGQGSAVDLIKSQAYLQLAYSLGQKPSEHLAKAAFDKLTAAEQWQANATYQQLVASVQINNPSVDQQPDADMPEPISRKEPTYPIPGSP